MKNKWAILIFLGVIQVVNMVGYLSLPKRTTKPVPVQPPAQPITPETRPQPKPEPPKKVEPTWTNWPPKRQLSDPSLGEVLLDIESHMPAGHIYRDNDKVTWAHETSHGEASALRQEFQGQGRINGFYCLKNRAVIIQEPPTDIHTVARAIPQSLRGGVYNLYMVQQAGSWNDTPLYICDEWMGYSNGSNAGIDLSERGLWRGYWRETIEAKEDLPKGHYYIASQHATNLMWGLQRSETVLYMLEFDVYAMTMASTIKGNYDHTQLKAFMMWNIERSIDLLKRSKSQPAFSDGAHDAYLNTLRTSPDAEQLRSFAKGYFGADWCQTVLGF